MLCQFTFSNFKSYKDEVTLDLCPANISEHPKTLIVDNTDGTKYLPIAAIYGPNGGGKSNVIEAFYFLKKVVLTPPRLDKNELFLEDDSTTRSNATQKKYFIFDDAQRELPSSFEVIFRAAEHEYKYILKIKDGLIIEENLYAIHTQRDIALLVFERTKDDIKLGELLNGAQTDKVNPAMPLIQYVSTIYDFDITRNAINWFKSTQITNYGNDRIERPLFLPDEPEKKQHFLDILHEMDIPINDILIEEKEDGKEDGRFIKAKVQTEYHLDNGHSFILDLSQESAGTKKLLSFLMLPLTALQTGSTLFVDELDAKLHPKIIEYIIHLFSDPGINKRGAQLIFTSHDLYTMNNTVFRRDEIWFAAKGADLSSRLYSLVEFKNGEKKTRKDESYGKRYIEGKYGADPYLKKIVNWEA